MITWTRTIWTEARQINLVLGWPEIAGDDEPPETFFALLRAGGEPRKAALFLGQALPRFEAIEWAAWAVQRFPSPRDGDAMTAVVRWLRDPSDAFRRAAYLASEPIREPTAGRLCALAVFTSGGSLALPDARPFPAPKDAAGRFAAAAVLVAASYAPASRQALDEALDFGSGLARRDIEGKP